MLTSSIISACEYPLKAGKNPLTIVRKMRSVMRKGSMLQMKEIISPNVACKILKARHMFVMLHLRWSPAWICDGTRSQQVSDCSMDALEAFQRS